MSANKPNDITNLKYAAAVFRRLTDPHTDVPTAADIQRLNGPMLEIALAILGEGKDQVSRRGRLKAEATARGLDLLLQEVEAVDIGKPLAEIKNLSNWQAYDLADVMLEELPPIQWLVRPYVPRPSVTAWFGKPKSMKSLLVLDMCLHVASGLPWLTVSPKEGGGLVVSQARVVWLDLENGSAALKRRMRAIAQALGMGKERGQVLAYSMPDPWPDFSNDENTASMITRVQELGDVGILVIDHLAQALGAVDENSPLIAQVMGHIRQIAETCNVAIVLIHHAKKGQGKDSGAPEDQLRGHGAILANVDAAYLVERDRSDRTNLKITPVAVRGPDAPNLAAKFSFEQDENLELKQARFWRQVWRDDMAIAKDAILQALGQGKKNYTELISAVKTLQSGLSNEKIRNAIAILEGVREIAFTKGDKGAKIYRINEVDDEDEN